MPVYEYHCPHCEKTQEVEQKASEKELSFCPECGKDGVRRLFSSSVSLRFKGSGFYCTDYKGPSGCCGSCEE